MAMSLGPYAFFVVTSYLAAALAVASLIAWIAIDYHHQLRQLRELEESGIVRRSGRGAAEVT